MVLRNVPSTATFEEQRVEINELAADVEALDAAALKAESDTLQTVTDRGFTTTNPIKIENNAATAFVIEDGSSNEKFVVDSVNGKLNVGSSAGGASGIYLFHNNAGATPAITLDGATGSITNKGQLVTESILSSAALNNKGSVQFGTVDAYSIGHMPLNSNLAFSQTHGGSYLFYSDASTVELEIASGGITVDGTCTVGDVVTSTIGDNQFAFAIGASAAKGGLYNHANGGYLFLRDSSSNGTLTLNGDSGSGTFTGEIKVEGSSTPAGLSSRISKYGSLLIGTTSDAVGDARLSIDSGNGNITSIGSATFAGNTTVGAPDVSNASTGGVNLFASGQLRIQRDGAGSASDKRFQMYYGTTETVAITADGAAYFKSVAAKSTFNLTNETTAARVQLSSDISGNYTGWKEKGVAAGSMSQASIDSKTPMLTDFTYPNASNGMLIWSTSKIGFAAGAESPQFGVGVQMLFDSSGLALGGVRAFDRTSTVNGTTDAKIKLFTNGSAEFAGSLDLTDSTIDLYSQTTNAASKTFQLFSDIGGTKAEKAFIKANGSAQFAETVSIGSGSAAPDDYGLIAYANTDTLSNKSAVYARNLGGGRNFTGDSAAGATTFEVFDSGRTVLTTSLGDQQLQLIGTEADLWLTSTGGSSTTWRILGSTGGSTHQFRIYDNTNSADRLTISSVGRVRLPAVPGVAGSNLANLQIEADGNLCTTTSIRAAKTNISPLADTSWLFDLNPVTFNWRTKTENEDGTLTWGEEADGGTQYGLIAEEVEEVKDDFCYYNNDGELSGVHYDRLVAPLLKVVQQQKEKIEALEARLDAAGL